MHDWQAELLEQRPGQIGHFGAAENDRLGMVQVVAASDHFRSGHGGAYPLRSTAAQPNHELLDHIETAPAGSEAASVKTVLPSLAT